MSQSNTHFYLRNYKEIMNNSKLSDKAKSSILLSKAENTVDAYESDWMDFVDWCRHKQESFFPSSPEIIVNYINDLADYAILYHVVLAPYRKTLMLLVLKVTLVALLSLNKRCEVYVGL